MVTLNKAAVSLARSCFGEKRDATTRPGVWGAFELGSQCFSNLRLLVKIPAKNGVTSKLPSEVAQCL